MTNNTNTIKNLKTAIELLQRDGWTQGTLVAPDGCMCALGAIGVATAGKQTLRGTGMALFHDKHGQYAASGLALAETQAVAETLRARGVDELHEGYRNVYLFNDGHAKDVEDVITLFEETIARLEKEDLKKHLENTKAALIKHGRGIGQLQSPSTGALCLLGAVSLAINGKAYGSGAYSSNPVTEALAEVILANKLDRERGGAVDQVFVFNDRTRDDEVVFGVIDAAIERVGA